jgi:hypothetical protein
MPGETYVIHAQLVLTRYVNLGLVVVNGQLLMILNSTHVDLSVYEFWKNKYDVKNTLEST